MLKHDSAHLEGACYINLSEILTQHKQALNKYKIGDPDLSLLPYTVQNESYHLSIDENRLGNAAYGQSSRISKLYHYVNYLLNIIFSVPQRKKPGFGYALTITGENLFWGHQLKTPGKRTGKYIRKSFPKGNVWKFALHVCTLKTSSASSFRWANPCCFH